MNTVNPCFFLKYFSYSKTVILKSGRGRLREVVVYERFQLQRYDYEHFGVLNKWSLLDFLAHGGSTVLITYYLSGTELKHYNRNFNE